MKRNILYYTISLVLIFSTFGLAAEPSGGKGHSKSDDHKFDFNSVLSHHLNDAVVIELNIGGTKVRPGSKEFDVDPKVGGVLKIRRYAFKDEQGLYKWQGGLDLHITKRVFMMFVVTFFLILTMVIASRVITRNPFRVNGKFAGIIETLIQFIRVDVVEKNMHGHGKGFEAYILSLFFFILFGNLFGLIPPPGEVIHQAEYLGKTMPHAGPGDTVPLIAGFWSGSTITGDVAVTFTLAAITTLLIWVTGFRYQGISFAWSFFPKGFPTIMKFTLGLILFPLLFVLELIVGPLAKGFALTIRLLANMTAGHVIILALLGFIFQFGLFVAPISVMGATAIYMLEIFVGFLQAFIFVLLTSIFVGSSMHAH